VQEEVIYRCINPACARPMPRPVNFCPWCGTAQGRAAPRAEERAGMAADTAMHAPAQGRREEIGAAAAASAHANANVNVNANVNAAPDVSRQAVATPPRQDDADAPRTTIGKGHAPPSATDFGRSAAQGRGSTPGAMGAAPAPAPQEVPRPPIPARPAQRKPVQLRWWILALAILWAVWLLAKPSARKIERQIEHASALARECKGGDAQDELIAGTPAEHPQRAIRDLHQAAPAQQGLAGSQHRCRRRPRRRQRRAGAHAFAGFHPALGRRRQDARAEGAHRCGGGAREASAGGAAGAGGCRCRTQ
jgi:hypothetical protein